MGWGLHDAAQVVGKSGDGGIDGVIKEIAWAWTWYMPRRNESKVT
jgi:hypothetical protein